MHTPDLTAADIPRKTRAGKTIKPPTNRWCYANPDGSTAFHICRWDKQDGKLLMPLTYGADGWDWVGPGAGRPLLYAPALAARPQCPVLLVEGEKTADAARAYLTKEWEVTTWSGGTQAIKQTDFSLLHGHPVIIWPDNDEPGLTAAAALSDILHGLDVQHAIVPLPDLPPKWDLADPVPDTIGGDAVAVLIARTLRDLTTPVPATQTPPAQVNGHHVETGIDNDIRIQCLGYRDRKFYFIASESQTILQFTGKELQKMEALRELCSDDTYWYKQYGSSGETPNFAGRVGAELIRMSYKTGIYSPENIRGRGCWMDRGRVVFHSGERLIVDGVPCDPIAIKSSNIYQKLPSFFDLTNTVPLTAAEGKALAKISHRLRWRGRDSLTADLFTGLIATAPICGTLRWRTHGWISGPPGSGKSFILNELAGRCLGPLSVRPEGSSTEAGIRQQIQSEAIPVLFDEAEAQGRQGVDRRNMIIQMMRSASTDGGGKLFKGTANHQAHAFKIQSQFMLASIGVSLTEAADATRCLVLELENGVLLTPEAQSDNIKRFREIERAIAALPEDMPQKLLCRMLHHAHDVRALADRAAECLMRKLGASTIRRVGDLLAAPLSGLWFLTHDAAPTDAQLNQWLELYNLTPWHGATSILPTDEATGVLAYIADINQRVEWNHDQEHKIAAGSGERTIGTMLAYLATGFTDDHKLSRPECQRVLADIGLKYEAADNGVWISPQNNTLSKLMLNAPYGADYIRVIKQHPAAKVSPKAFRIGNKLGRNIWVPLAAILGPEGNAAPYEPGEDG